MTNYTYNVGNSPVQSDSGALTWNQNGTLQKLVINDQLNPSDSQTCNYTYDDLFRIAGNNCGSAWSQTFSIDPFGNNTKTGSSSFNASYDQTTNHIAVHGLTGCTISYDANGNPLNDCARGTQDTYTWDAEGHAVALDGNTVVYDALGRAVEYYPTNSPPFYGPIIYSPMGQKVAVLSVYSGTPYLNRAYVPLPGGGTAVYGSSGLMFFWHPDWLGTARLGTTPARGLYLDRAYAPYGENYANSGATWDLSFTGKSQDLISSTYDFPARNYSAISGRWYSPDPAGLAAVDPTNPQTWNRYAYVGNNPLGNFDPLGLCGQVYTTTLDSGGNVIAMSGTQFEDGGYPCVPPPAGCMYIGSGGSGFGQWAGMQCGFPMMPCPQGTTAAGQNCIGVPTIFAANNGPTIGAAPRTPWYKNSCVTGALAKGAVSAVIDGIGLIPGGGAVSAELSLFHGAAAVSNGTAILGRVTLGAGIITTANGASNTSQLGVTQTTVGVAGIVAALAKATPVVGQVLSGI